MAKTKRNPEAVNQKTVTSTVKVQGVVTTRTYSDGAVQRNVHASEAAAKEYAASVAQVEGHK